MSLIKIGLMLSTCLIVGCQDQQQINDQNEVNMTQTDSDINPSPDENIALAVKYGSFMNVSGLGYKTQTHSGVTDIAGTFEYVEGEEVEFYLGNKKLGSAIGQEIITPYELEKIDYMEDESEYTNTHNELIKFITLFYAFDYDFNPNNGIELTDDIINLINEKYTLFYSDGFNPYNFEFKVNELLVVARTNGLFLGYENEYKPYKSMDSLYDYLGKGLEYKNVQERQIHNLESKYINQAQRIVTINNYGLLEKIENKTQNNITSWINYEYDDRDNIKVQTSYGINIPIKIEYFYDDNNRLYKQEDTNSQDVVSVKNWIYDDYGNLKQYSTSWLIENYSYDEHGRVSIQYIESNGDTSLYAYGNNNEKIKIGSDYNNGIYQDFKELRNGRVYIHKKDLDGDGEYEYFEYYDYNDFSIDPKNMFSDIIINNSKNPEGITSIKIDNNNDGVFDSIETWVLDSNNDETYYSLDENNDGVLENERVYEFNGEKLSSILLHKNEILIEEKSLKFQGEKLTATEIYRNDEISSLFTYEYLGEEILWTKQEYYIDGTIIGIYIEDLGIDSQLLIIFSNDGNTISEVIINDDIFDFEYKKDISASDVVYTFSKKGFVDYIGINLQSDGSYETEYTKTLIEIDNMVQEKVEVFENGVLVDGSVEQRTRIENVSWHVKKDHDNDGFFEYDYFNGEDGGLGFYHYQDKNKDGIYDSIEVDQTIDGNNYTSITVDNDFDGVVDEFRSEAQTDNVNTRIFKIDDEEPIETVQTCLIGTFDTCSLFSVHIKF